jgi:hypothetical protein
LWAEQRSVKFGDVLATLRKGLQVMELHVARLVAALALLVGERATRFIAREYLASFGRWGVSAALARRRSKLRHRLSRRH